MIILQTVQVVVKILWSYKLAVLCELGQLPLYYLCFEYMFKFYKRFEEMEYKKWL